VIPRNVQKIGHFVAVAKAKSLSEAARQLGISQPALTASIRKLEATLGFELFDREHGFHLSAMGTELLSRAESAFLHLLDLEREVALLRYCAPASSARSARRAARRWRTPSSARRLDGC
jgi:DNA-binding transcriptional LysR family regulator